MHNKHCFKKTIVVQFGYAEDNTKTIEDYIKLYEDMHLNSQVYDDFNVAYLISEASS